MRDMADLDAVNLGLDENEADIAEELQDFDDSFDTRSEASESGSESSDSQTSISSVSTAPSSNDGGGSNSSKRKTKTKTKSKTVKKTLASKKRSASPAEVNGKKKKRTDNTKSTTKSKSELSVANTVNNTSSDTPNENAKSKTRKKAANSTSNVSNVSSGSQNNQTLSTTDNKSDVSDAEDEKPTLPTLQSDSESEDSDSGANHKRNGARKAASKSVTPERKTAASNSNSGGGKSSPQKSYDYMTKLNYLFRDTRFFLIKSNNTDNINISKSKNVWATLPQNDSNLNQAFKEARNVLLIFSVNESGKFAGFARMAAQSRRDIPQVAWVLPPSISAKALGGVIELDWICRKELSFNATLHLHNSWNEGKPVKIGRDGQEIEPKIGAELCRLFPEDEKVELTPILRKSKETAKEMREKGLHVIYKPPRSLSTRGGSGRGGNSNLGPMRHKRNYGGHGHGGGGGGPHHHRPYKLHHHHHHHPGMGPPGGGFKRNSSPYRPGGSGGPGGSRAGGGDAGNMPSWERYMSSAAAAEAYVADYMRTMHGQLPPLPFVPPFAQMPLPAGGGGSGGGIPPPGGPSSIYEQLPPPVRYYDGPGPPPLPDYPPPQPMRPPPPGFDKAPPSYEEFAAWKNAGLPTVPPPPGFAGYGGSMNGGGNDGSGAGGLGSNGGGLGGSGNGSIGGGNSYRNRDNSGMNRSRDRRGEYQPRGTNARVNERERHHFRAGGGSDRGQRSYRDGSGRR